MAESFHFLRPFWLLAIPVAVLLGWLIRRARDPLRGWRASMDSALMEAMVLGGDRCGESRRGLVWLAAVVLGSIAVAGPVWRHEPSPFSDDPAPVLMVLRADQSMASEDLSPSRLERAHLKIADFAEARPGQPLGLIAYAGSAHLVLPPTRDTEVVAAMAANVSPEIMPEKGDDLAGALRLAGRTLAETGGSIIVVADDAPPVSAEDLEGGKSKLPPVHFLAIARENTPELDAIGSAATSLGADFILMTPDRSDVDSLVRRAAGAPVRIDSDEAGNRWAEDGWWLVPLIGLLLLTRFRKQHSLEPVEASS